MSAELYKDALRAAAGILNVHIRTKSMPGAWDFHQATDIWEGLFDIAHDIGEMNEDLGCPIAPEADCAKLKAEACSLIENLKAKLEACAADPKTSVAMDNLVRGAAEKLQTHYGTLMAFKKGCEVSQPAPLK